MIDPLQAELDEARRKGAEIPAWEWDSDQDEDRTSEWRVPVSELQRRNYAELARSDEPRLGAEGKVVDLERWYGFAYTRKMAWAPQQWAAFPLPGPRPSVLTPHDLRDWSSRTGRAVTPEGTWWRALVLHAADYEWWTSQIDGRWAHQLRPDLVDPAWVALYLSTIDLTGPVSRIAEASTDPSGLAVRRLADLGLISLDTRARGQWTYRTLHRLRNVGGSGDWDQPPAWPLA